MADERFSSSRAGDADTADGPRGSRPPGGRDSGGFRIRLSDNEMQGARALQEALGLRSTVAVLGFSLRTLAQMLEQGQLDELIAQQRAQATSRPTGPREGGRGEGGRGERRRERSGADREGSRGGHGERVNPFARPARPAVPSPTEEPLGSEPQTEEDPLAHDPALVEQAPTADEADTTPAEA